MSTFEINRAPVLTLWATVVAERLGYDKDTALSLGKAVAGLTAQRKGQRLGIYQKKEHAGEPEPAGEVEWVGLVGRQVPTCAIEDGVRAVIRGQAQTPESSRQYLESKFKDRLGPARKAMEHLAAAYEPDELNRVANRLYEKFRPAIPPGTRGWGAKGKLDLQLIRSLAGEASLF
jgi:hypothetical protein